MNDSMNVSFLDYTIDEYVAEECDLERHRARSVVNLFNDGCEVAFVARYRCAQTGNMTCEQVRKAYEAFNNAKELAKKAEKAVTNLQTKLQGPELQSVIGRLKQVRETSDITDITSQYTTKGRKTKADKARELGLEVVAQSILDGKMVDLSTYQNGKELKSLKDVQTQVAFLLADLMNKLPGTVEAVKKISHLESRVWMTVIGELSTKAKKLTEKDKDFYQINHFSTYTNFSKDVRRVENYQVLALCRGEEKEIISWKIEMKNVDREHPCCNTRVHQVHGHLFKEAFEDSIARLFLPKLQRATRRFLVNRAEQAAIACFSRNLGQLFAQSPIQGCHVAALDPGYNACKAAFLSPNGNVLDTCEFVMRNKQFDPKGKQKMKEWSTQAGSHLVVAIGNGKASVETQFALSNLIQDRSFFGRCDVEFCVVPENGASKYSVTPLAEEELPDMPPTQRSAVSIGRRIIDPMAEYVKIEPKHLGMGMYQHSVNEKRLSEALSLVVRECVSMKGVDVNSASVQLLQQVCGLTKKTAAGIVTLRDKEGGILTREQLKKVKGLGEKAFEQCAGFLIVRPSQPSDDEPRKKKSKVEVEPLDRTIIHPTQYHVTRSLLSRLRLSVDEALSQSGREKLQECECKSDEEAAIRDLLLTDTPSIEAPPLQKAIRSVASLNKGEKFWGRVMNQVDFGLFIDIGVECNGMAHKSQLPQPIPQVGTTIRVEVLSVEPERKRIGLKIIDE